MVISRATSRLQTPRKSVLRRPPPIFTAYLYRLLSLPLQYSEPMKRSEEDHLSDPIASPASLIHLYMFKYMYAYIYIYVYMYVYIHVVIYLYAHAHAYTNTQISVEI